MRTWTHTGALTLSLKAPPSQGPGGSCLPSLGEGVSARSYLPPTPRTCQERQQQPPPGTGLALWEKGAAVPEAGGLLRAPKHRPVEFLWSDVEGMMDL